jgi:hypothetical protein
MLLLVIAGTKLGVDAFRASRDADWARYKPTSWLVREIESSDAKLRDASRAELSAGSTGWQLPRRCGRPDHAARPDASGRSVQTVGQLVGRLRAMRARLEPIAD